MSSLPKNIRQVLLLSIGFDHVRAALADKKDAQWQIVAEGSASVTSVWQQGIDEALASLFQGAGNARAEVKHVIVVTPRCRPLLLNQVIPPELSTQQAKELLRWEVSAVLASHLDEHGLEEVAHWESGYAPCGSKQTSIAAIAVDFQKELQKELQSHGLTLFSVVPTLIVGWAQLLQPGAAAKGAIAIAQHAGEECSLSVFEQGQLEFHALYPATVSNWPTSLQADARSFPVKKLLVLNEPDTVELTALAQLPPAEIQQPHAFWFAVLQCCQLNKNERLPLQVPVVACVEATPSIWNRPSTWWAAALGASALVTASCLFQWVSEVNAMNRQKESIEQAIVLTLERLKAFESQAQEYDRMEQELQATEYLIKEALADAEKPGRSACAQVPYVVDALRSAATAFSGKVRLAAFDTDYKGRVLVRGQSVNDAAALAALSKFYDLIKEYPVQPSVMSSTKEGAPPGRILFMADETNLAIAKANYVAGLGLTQPNHSGTKTLAAPNIIIPPPPAKKPADSANGNAVPAADTSSVSSPPPNTAGLDSATSASAQLIHATNATAPVSQTPATPISP